MVVGLQVEQGVMIEDQVEFYIVIVMIGLEFLLLFIEWCVFVVLDDWQVGVDIGIVDGVDEGEVGVEVLLVEVVEEQVVDVVWFVVVFEVEVVVVLFFIVWVDVCVEWCVGVVSDLVLMYVVFFVGVVGGQIEVVVELLDWFFVFFFGVEEMYVGMGCWYVGVFWMDYQ